VLMGSGHQCGRLNGHMGHWDAPWICATIKEK